MRAHSKATPLTRALAASLLASVTLSAHAPRDDRALAELADKLALPAPTVEDVTAPLARLGEGALASPSSLARALWLSRRYDRVKLRKGKVTEERLEVSRFEHGLAFAYRTPKKYDTVNGHMLVLALPDEGERIADHIRDRWSSKAFREHAIIVCPEMPEVQGEWDKVMVDGRPGGLCHVLTTLRAARERFAIDPNRIYLAGRGKSVQAAVAAGHNEAQEFAGVVGCAGLLDLTSGVDAVNVPMAPENFANLPTLLIDGGPGAQTFADALAEAGYESCTLRSGADDDEVYEWMKSHPRIATPESVEVVRGNPFPMRKSWLRITADSPSARARAWIDRARREIHIESSEASYATLYLNDALLPLDGKFTIVTQGKRREVSVTRSIAAWLGNIFDGTSDTGCVYTAELTVPIGATTAEATADLPGPLRTLRTQERGQAVISTTTSDRVVERAFDEFEHARRDLVRIFGGAPQEALEVSILGNEAQYDSFSFGSLDGRLAPADASRRYLVHSAYFADRLVRPNKKDKAEFAGQGVCYWDELAPHGDAYGIHAVRLAYGLSFADAMDPSPKVARRALSRGFEANHSELYEDEKVLPEWFRVGAAVYAERFFEDDRVPEDGDPLWARRWSLENLADRGGLRDLDQVFAFEIDPVDRDDGLHRMLEAGLLINFLVDGQCAATDQALSQLQRGITSGRVLKSQVQALEDALRENEEQLRSFGV